MSKENCPKGPTDSATVSWWSFGSCWCAWEESGGIVSRQWRMDGDNWVEVPAHPTMM